MAIPTRHAARENIVSAARTFFATTKASQGCPLLQSERNAALMIDVLRSYAAAGKFHVHDFVIMPNHLHLSITAGGNMTIEKAMQFIKGGFSEVRVNNHESFWQHRKYIAENPVKSGLVPIPFT